MSINYKEIDSEMIPIIKALNKKGYKTVFCCQGHFCDSENRYYGGYIYFHHNINVRDIEMPNFESVGYRYSERKTVHPFWTIHKNGIYWVGDAHKKPSMEDKEIEHNRAIELLTEWANGLRRAW